VVLNQVSNQEKHCKAAVKFKSIGGGGGAAGWLTTKKTKKKF